MMIKVSGAIVKELVANDIKCGFELNEGVLKL